jgi:lipoprotein-anchoring transpeptidase ErfK/SrfK
MSAATAVLALSQVAAASPYTSIINEKKMYWSDKTSGETHIRIDLSDQMAYLYKGDLLMKVAPVSTGRPSHDTPTGTYHISEKDIDHKSNKYGVFVDEFTGQVVQTDVDTTKHPRPAGARFRGAAMHYFLRVNGAIGMHDGPLPGFPDSHGCIRLPRDAAKYFYDQASVGTRVTITH